MAARIKNYHTEEVRKRIQTSQLLNRLTNHALGEVDMTSTQVTAALGVLKKSLPDLQSVALTDPSHEGPARLLIEWIKE